jgi:hypothetical protein
MGSEFVNGAEAQGQTNTDLKSTITPPFIKKSREIYAI